MSRKAKEAAFSSSFSGLPSGDGVSIVCASRQRRGAGANTAGGGAGLFLDLIVRDDARHQALRLRRPSGCALRAGSLHHPRRQRVEQAFHFAWYIESRGGFFDRRAETRFSPAIRRSQTPAISSPPPVTP